MIKNRKNIHLFLNLVIIILLSSCGFVEETNFLTNSSTPSGPPWWNESWSNRKKLTFDSSSQTEDLVDFPVLLKLDNTRIDYSKTQNSGQDIRFVDQDDDTVLSHEIELWDEGGESWVWVKIPQIDGSSDTDYIWMYYGNDGVSDGQDATNVWDSNYIGVWHLSESSGTLYDSTVNGNNGTPQGTPILISGGAVDGAKDFDAGSDRVNISINLGATVTISTWAKLDIQGDMLWCINTGNNGPDLFFTGSNIYLNTWDGSGNPFCPQPASVNQWHHYATVIESGIGNTILYIDGNSSGTANYRNPSSNIIYIGSSSTTYTWNGSVDEFRISNTARSADWINAQHLSMNDNFISFGSEQ